MPIVVLAGTISKDILICMHLLSIHQVSISKKLSKSLNLHFLALNLYDIEINLENPSRLKAPCASRDLFFLPFYAWGESGDVVRSSLGARGEQVSDKSNSEQKSPPWCECTEVEINR